MSIMNAANTEPYVSNADLSSYQYYFVALDAQGDGVGLATTAGQGNAGILVNQPESGQVAEVAFQDGMCSYAIVADASASVGDLLTTDTAGKGTVTTTAGVEVNAVLLQAVSAANSIARVRLTHRVAD